MHRLPLPTALRRALPIVLVVLVLAGPITTSAQPEPNAPVYLPVALSKGEPAPAPTAGPTPLQPTPTPTPASPREIHPHDPVVPFELATLSGRLVLDDAATAPNSYVFVLHHPRAPITSDRWQTPIDALLAASPDNVHYVFLSYERQADDVRARMEALDARIDTALAELPAAERERWRAQFHLVTESASHIDGWLGDLLHSWGGVLPGVHAQWQVDGQPQVVEPAAVAGGTDWLPALEDVGTVAAPLAWYGRGCNEDDPVQDVTDRIALIERGACAFYDKLTNAASDGAVAAIVFTDDRDKIAMGCGAPSDCSNGPGIPGVMIDRAPGLQLRDRLLDGTTVEATLEPIEHGALLFAIDRLRTVREFGLLGGLLDTTAETTYYNWEADLAARLAAEEDAGAVTVVDVFEDELVSDPGWAGERSYAEVELPDAEVMAQLDTLELELTMACRERRDANCPPWDYLVHLYLCDADDSEQCDTELGRWITPYGREGHWVTDVSSLLPLLSDGGTRRFAFYSQQAYTIDLSLRFSQRRDLGQPAQMVPLFTGGAFDAEYNDKYEPLAVDVPEDVTRVELVAVITGHGWGRDQANCAEFCNHTHHFTLNDTDEFVKAHPDAGTDLGCALRVDQGVVPNQYGTWHFGRAGWCPGLEVEPWVVDVTDSVTPGAENTIAYRALYQGEEYDPQPADPPNPNGFDARINMVSYLVYYR